MMEKKQCTPVRGFGKYLIALLFIASGVLLLARNAGWLDNETFHIIVSWQMALIGIGAYWLLTRNYLKGLFMILIGGCFLLPKLGLPWVSGAVMWPVVLISIGLVFLFRPRKRDNWKHRMRNEFAGSRHNQSHSTDGFVRSENVFGGVRQVVLDEVFKGATLHNTFGGTVIDLRRTTLAEGETYIDIECAFGGVEIYVPSDWKVDIRCSAFLGGCEDKRFVGIAVEQSRVLVIRGEAMFGGIEIKN